MEFPDFPFPQHIRTFSGHQDVLQYLRDYCEHFDLQKFIRFKTKVKHVTPFLDCSTESSMSWKVTVIDDNDIETTSIFNAVIVCNG